MIKKIVKIFLILLISITSANAQQDSIPPVVQIDTTVFSIGDQIHFRLSLPVPKGKEAIFPDFKEKIGESLEIISKTIDTLELKDNIQQITHDYLVTSFDTGYIFIPPFEVGIVEEGYNSTMTTDSAMLYVNYPIVDMEKGIFDIKPPADLPFKFSEWLPYAKIIGIIFLVILAIVAILLYYFLIYKKKKEKKQEEIVDNRPADVKALEALSDLKAKKLWQNDRVKLYYSELTDIIRHYLDERYGMHTMESTSSEILTAIKLQDVKPENIDCLRDIFSRADMAKFAKGNPLPDENDKSWSDAVQFVQHTKEIIINTEKGGAK
ncbi:hypothetical protein C7377_0827 [Balneicella halophila]|uniref:Oxygen tolerance protein BatD n=1 Tax=Balneicella halophila TaxID=1537566 RepID=A0A7L4UTI9_BALHA|nr:hypothetical protein [Balneicella halophila]PVX52504.1 hypothetical protein C7377_0827 [Balneicella halophila]